MTTISVPVVLLFGAIAWVLWRHRGLRLWHLAICLLLGWFLAASSTAPEIRKMVNDLISALTNSVGSGSTSP